MDRFPPPFIVIPAKAGTQDNKRHRPRLWGPAFAGMTVEAQLKRDPANLRQ